jgi:hypothetical protein
MPNKSHHTEDTVITFVLRFRYLLLLFTITKCIIHVECTNCLRGTYSIDGTDDNGPCIDCPIGYTTQNYLTDSPDASKCRLCAPGYSGTAITTSLPPTGCIPCPIGKYTPGNINGGLCITCKLGYTTIGSGTGGSFPSTCTICDAGYRGTSGAGTNGCYSCVTGLNYNANSGNNVVCTTCDPNSTGCVYNSAGTCAAGYAGDARTGTCKLCLQGKYAPAINGGTCSSCNVGYSTTSSGTGGNTLASCDRCAAGYAGTPIGGTTGCTICPKGTFSDVSAGIPCKSCNAGYTTPRAGVNSTDTSVCVFCSPGYSGTSSMSATLTGCSLCPQGKYSEGNKNDGKCISCLKGFTTPNVGTSGTTASVCNRCAGGYEGTPIGGTTGCTICPSGKYSPIGSGLTCSTCRTGYSNWPPGTTGNDDTACSLCDWGYNGFSVGGTSGCTSCPQGKYSDLGNNAYKCKTCTVGYTTSSSATSGRDTSVCTVCDRGTYSSNGLASGTNTGCTFCTVGYTTLTHNTIGSDTSVCTMCAPGYSGSSNGDATTLGGCIACPQGKYGPGNSNSAACTSCNTGYSTSSEAMNGNSAIACNRCASGYQGTTTDGITGCTICPQGKFSVVSSLQNTKITSNSCLDCKYGFTTTTLGTIGSDYSACNICDIEVGYEGTTTDGITGCTYLLFVPSWVLGLMIVSGILCLICLWVSRKGEGHKKKIYGMMEEAKLDVEELARDPYADDDDDDDYDDETLQTNTPPKNKNKY